MKQLHPWMLVILIVCSTINVGAQTGADSVYVFPADHPDAALFLPAPPDSLSLDFVDDVSQWQWGKRMRATARGAQASRESMWLPDIMRITMAQVLDLDTISDATTPALNRLLVKAYNTGCASTAKPKKQYMRTRPFMMMNEPTWAQYDDDFLRTNGSYPSGHTAFGWTTALLFAEMWPALQDTILRRGYEFGVSRIITGAHWQSDVNAGYLCAAASVARAHTVACLEDDILAARKEYARIKGLAVPDSYPIETFPMPQGARILGSPVDTASSRYIGEYMRYRQAVSLRPTMRGRQAAEEGNKTMPYLAQLFGSAMGITVSETATPALYQLILAARTSCSRAATTMKEAHFRKRPFVQLGEATTIPTDEALHIPSSSYPSAHAAMAWGIALALVEAVPEHQNDILRAAYQYGYSRVITGYHWAADVDAGRLLACAVIARCHADEQFRRLITAARAEYQRK